MNTLKEQFNKGIRLIVNAVLFWQKVAPPCPRVEDLRYHWSQLSMVCQRCQHIDNKPPAVEETHVPRHLTQMLKVIIKYCTFVWFFLIFFCTCHTFSVLYLKLMTGIILVCCVIFCIMICWGDYHYLNGTIPVMITHSCCTSCDSLLSLIRYVLKWPLDHPRFWWLRRKSKLWVAPWAPAWSTWFRRKFCHSWCCTHDPTVPSAYVSMSTYSWWESSTTCITPTSITLPYTNLYR